MNPIFNALNSGYSPQQILGYLSKAIPQMAPAIKKATKMGYPAQQILGFLSKTFETEDRRGMSESERHAVNSKADAERAKFGLKALGAAVATPIAAQVAGNAITRILPGPLRNPAPGVPSSVNPTNPGATNPLNTALAPTPVLPQQVQPSPILPSPTPNVPPTLPQNAPTIQPQVNSTNVVDALKKFNLSSHVEKLAKNRSDPKDIAAILYSQFPKEMSAFQKEIGMFMEDGISQYLANLPKGTPVVPEVPQNQSVTAPNVQDMYQKGTTNVPNEDESVLSAEEMKPVKIEKKSTVISPNGIGQVKEIRNGKALIDVDGKLHKANEEDLISSPIPEKDLAELYEDLTKGIEKATGKQISRNVDWAGYDPKTNELAYKPHGSDKLYAYADISPEDVELLTSLLTQRKSTGENFIGAWEAESESPIGAAMYQLIKKLQAERGGKGNEYKNRYETIYDALEPAKKAAKEKYAREKAERRKKKA